MIKIFKQNGIGQFVVLLAATLLLWMGPISRPPAMVPAEGYAPLYDLLFRILLGHDRLAAILAMLVVIAESLILSSTLYNYKLMSQGTILPSLLYVAAMSMSLPMMTLSPTVLMNLALLIALDRLMVIGVPTLEVRNVFGSALFIAIASLFYPPSLFILVPLFIVFSIYKMYRLREWAVLILGFAAPFIILFVWAFLNGTLEHTCFMILRSLSDFGIRLGAGDWLDWVTCMSLTLLTLTGLVTFAASNELSADGQRNGIVLALMLLFDVILFLLTRIFPFNAQIIAIPFAFLVNGILLRGGKRKWIFESLLWLILLLAVVNVWRDIVLTNL